MKILNISTFFCDMRSQYQPLKSSFLHNDSQWGGIRGCVVRRSIETRVPPPLKHVVEYYSTTGATSGLGSTRLFAFLVCRPEAELSSARSCSATSSSARSCCRCLWASLQSLTWMVTLSLFCTSGSAGGYEPSSSVKHAFFNFRLFLLDFEAEIFGQRVADRIM